MFCDIWPFNLPIVNSQLPNLSWWFPSPIYQNIKKCFQLVRERIPAEQNFYSNRTLSRTNCLCVQLVSLLVPSFRLIPYASLSRWKLVPKYVSLTLIVSPQLLIVASRVIEKHWLDQNFFFFHKSWNLLPFKIYLRKKKTRNIEQVSLLIKLLYWIIILSRHERKVNIYWWVE